MNCANFVLQTLDYGTTIFAATGLSNSYVTSIILGTVNVAATIFGLWMVENVGRRKAMMGGAAWMGVCLFIYSFIGHYQLDPINPLSTPQAGNIMIVFTCLYVFPTPFALRTALTQQ